MEKVRLCCAAFVALVGVGVARADSSACPLRWVYVMNDLTKESYFDALSNGVERMVASGFNGLVWACGTGEEGFDFHRCVGARRERFLRARRLCEQKGVEIVPLLWSVGRAHGILDYDFNLGEAAPLKDVPYVSLGNTAVFDPEEREFAWRDGERFPDPLHLEIRPGSKPGTFDRGTMTRTAKIRPYRRYRLTFQTRTEGVGAVGRNIRSAYDLSVRWSHDGEPFSPGRELFSIPAREKLDWIDACFDFIAGSNDEARIGIWMDSGAERGWAEFRNFKITPLGLQKIVRREGAPMSVRSAATGKVYAEGRDWRLTEKSLPVPERATDPDFRLEIPAGSSIPKGEKLLVSAYTLLRRSAHQAGVCMGNPALYRYFGKSMDEAVQVFGPCRRWFLPMDEIRAGGSCEACQGIGLGRLLAACLRAQCKIIRKRVPKAEIYVWADMFSPYSNAREAHAKYDYALCRGAFWPISDNLPKDIVPVIWSGEGTMEKELAHFNALGYPVVYAGFYDSPSIESFRGIGSMKAMKRAADCRGFLFTSWKLRGNFEPLPAYGEALTREFGPLRK